MNVVTVGGVVLGLGLLVWRLIVWWPGLPKLRKAPAQHGQRLVPFIYAWCYGVVMILCVGGLIGAAADFVLWGSNWMGDVVFVWGVGGQAQQSVSRPAVSALTSGGSAFTLLLTFVFFALLKKSESTRSDMKVGAWSGICLGLSKGVAGAAAVPLASAVNLMGAWLGTEVLV